MHSATSATRDLTGMTPMMVQYHTIKEKAGSALLFYRMGDFYELFFDDAVKAAAALDITLTRRGKQNGEDIPMAGVPFHAAENYLSRLIRKGFSVAICEQTEDPAEAKKKRGSKAVVSRDIVRIVTPGTLTEDTLLEPRAHNDLAALVIDGDQGAFATIDISTGDVSVYAISAEQMKDTIGAIQPAEILYSDEEEMSAALSGLENTALSPLHPSMFDWRAGESRIRELYNVGTLEGFGHFTRPQLAALGAAISYLEVTQVDRLPLLKAPKIKAPDAGMLIDFATRRSLELTEGASGGKSGSLLHAIDRTVSGAGGRLLSRWLSMPLTDLAEINQRLDAVEAFVAIADLRERMREALRGKPDMARAMSRLSAGRGGPRDLAAIKTGLEVAKKVRSFCEEASTEFSAYASFADVAAQLSGVSEDRLVECHAQLEKSLADDLPLLARDGGFIAPGCSPDLDELRALKSNARQVLAELETRYREQTGVKSLKIKHSKVLGYMIDVSSAHAERLREEHHQDLFRHRQTLANSTRFVTAELADLDQRIVHSGEQALALELSLFEELAQNVCNLHAEIMSLADVLATIDVLSAMAHIAEQNNYVRPQIEQGPVFDIKDGRHPVVEMMVQEASSRTKAFIPNSCRLGDGRTADVVLVTGPNMAGKSTFLRQNALLAVMAQSGSFVPASQAVLGIVDRLFSRVGASDDIAKGRSTFMVEMVETAAILNQATPNSLVILDEVGRGTSTFDGMSIAWATLEHLHDNVRCRTLFATHYHELTHLSEKMLRLRNVSMAAKEWRGDVVFLHEVKEGPADRSYGLAVARLAGLPAPVLSRAKDVLRTFEKEKAHHDDPLPLFEAASPELPSSLLHETLGEIDPDSLSPKEAHDILYRLKKIAGEG